MGILESYQQFPNQFGTGIKTRRAGLYSLVSKSAVSVYSDSENVIGQTFRANKNTYGNL
jgi:hypothetical protein